jgi:hypothetical protein
MFSCSEALDQSIAQELFCRKTQFLLGDLARIFGVSDATIDNWKVRHPDFLGSLKAGKEEADTRVEQSGGRGCAAVLLSRGGAPPFSQSEMSSNRNSLERHLFPIR